MPGVSYSNDIVRTRRRMLSHIDEALTRLRLQEALRASVLSLTVVLWILVPMVLADRILSLSQLGISIWIIWGGLACLSIPYILWRAFSDRLNEQLAAILADDRLGLHSRLCTSLALPGDDDSAFGELFYREAAEGLRNLDATKAFPVEWPRLARYLPIPLALAAALWFGMEPQDRMGWVAQAQEKRLLEEARKKSVEPLRELKIQDLKREEKESAIEDSASYKVNKLIQQAKDVAQELQEGKINSEQALQQLAQLKREIGDARDEHAFDKTENRLKGLKDDKLNLEESAMTREISEALKDNDPALAAQKMRQLASKVRDEIMNNPDKTPEQKAQELQKLQEEVERLAGALAEQQAMRDQLQELSEKTMDAADYQKLQQQLKEQNEKNQNGGNQNQPGQKNQNGEQNQNGQQGQKDGQQNGQQSAQEMADQLEQAMQEVAEGLDELEEESYQPDEADEAMNQLEDQVDGALDGL